MRGEKSARAELVSAGLRITPACAGKRATMGAILGAVEDHPRMRGEKVLLL